MVCLGSVKILECLLRWLSSVEGSSHPLLIRLTALSDFHWYSECSCCLENSCVTWCWGCFSAWRELAENCQPCRWRDVSWRGSWVLPVLQQQQQSVCRPNSGFGYAFELRYGSLRSQKQVVCSHSWVRLFLSVMLLRTMSAWNPTSLFIRREPVQAVQGRLWLFLCSNSLVPFISSGTYGD